MGKRGGSRTDRRALVRRQVLLTLATAFAAFVLLSLVTWVPAGLPGGNVCGAAGRVVAEPILKTFGLGSFVLFGMLLWWGTTLLRGRTLLHPALRGLSIVLMTLCASGFFALLMDPRPYYAGGMVGAGGLIGGGLAYRLELHGGAVGSYLFTVTGILVGLTLATDLLFLELARDLKNGAVGAGRRLSEGAPKALAGLKGAHLPKALRFAWLGSLLRRLPSAAQLLPAVAVGEARRTPASEKPLPDLADVPLDEAPTEVIDLPEAESEPDEEAEAGAEADEPGPEDLDLDADEAPAAEIEPAGDEDAPSGEDASAGPAPEKPRARPRPVKSPAKSPAKSTAKGPSKKRRASRKPQSSGWEFPPIDLLDKVKRRDPRAQEAMIRENGEILEETLREFKVDAEVVDYTRGPVVTLYELDLAAGVKVNRIHNLSEDLAVALKAPSVRVVAPLPGKSTIGVEVPNPVRDDVRIRPLVESDDFQRDHGHLPIFLGTDVSGIALIEDLTTMPHVLIAGATGSGKSVAINAVLLSLLLTRTPEEVRMILIDPKQVELAFFSKVPHLMSPVVTDMKKAVTVLMWLVEQMEERYAMFHAMEVRNIHSYNELGGKKIRERMEELGVAEPAEGEDPQFPEQLPYIVIVVDELADLMMVAGKEIENLITRLAQKSRAVGIHIILATQRPSTDVITGLIKANMPSRVSFQVASKIDSRVILDQNGAEKLLGRGDMLYLPPRTSHLVRSQGTFVSDGEVKRVVRFLADRAEQEFDERLAEAQTGRLLDDEEKDPLYDEAVRVVLEEQRGSASLLQRALGVGYTRGSRLMDLMHKEGIVGAYKGSKARDVLMTLEEYEAMVGARREAS